MQTDPHIATFHVTDANAQRPHAFNVHIDKFTRFPFKNEHHAPPSVVVNIREIKNDPEGYDALGAAKGLGKRQGNAAQIRKTPA